MEIDGYLFVIDTAAKLHRYLRVAGWFHHETDALARVSLQGADMLAESAETGFDHGGVLPDLGPGKGFRIEALMADDAFPEDAAVVFETRAGRTLIISLPDLIADREGRYAAGRVFDRFRDAVNGRPGGRLLEMGGRDRSRLGDRREFTGAAVTVLDVIAGEGVDVVGDAHHLSNLLPAESFDFIHSRSVFEHLLMPWKVAVEMNRVLKPGGLVFVTTHQTLGLHDQPWDFLRFSKDSWPGFFNAGTGFEIVEAFEEREQFIIPWLWRRDKPTAEGSVGFEASGVLARKTGPAQLDWPADPAEIIETAYPDTPDGAP